MVGLDLPLGHVQNVGIENGNEKQKFISMKTKSHSYHDFDSSLPHDTMIHFVLILFPFLFPHTKCTKSSGQ